MNKTGRHHQDFPIRNILVVDDEESLRSVLTRALTRAGFSCRSAECARQALDLLDSERIDLIISDLSMPGMDGIEFLKKIKAGHPETDVIIMDDPGSSYAYVDIMDAGASDYMAKPFRVNITLAKINRIAREKKNVITLKKTNQELRVAMDRANVLVREAREASRAKTFFLASMSHEIRTPLNGIVGYTDMLLDTPLNDEQRSFLKNAKLSCQTLLSVVNDILDFSKVEAGKLSLETITFDPEVLCYDTIDVVRTRVDESKVELICSVGDSVSGQVIGDPHRFRQVLLNLLGNAVKFTRKGFIKLCLDAKKTDDDSSMLIVSIQDSGPGISKHNLEKIFNPFIQSENDMTRRNGGTGLGLAISKNIANRMGGDVWAESTEEKGSTFYFTASFKTGDTKKVQRVRPAELTGKKILLSTTSEETKLILFHELGLAGMEVFHRDLDDLPAFLSDRAGQSFDVAIIDFGKSVKGVPEEFIRKMKGIRKEMCRFEFIACSVPVPGIAETFRKAGFKGFLPKPIPKKKLFEMISYVMGMETEEEGTCENHNEIVTAHLVSENKKYGASILLVEDNPVNQKMTCLILSKAGYMIDIANDGREAVSKYTAHPEAYDLIFMDINMPRMDGFQATKLIRSFERENGSCQKIPILALTANVLEDFKRKGIEAGMDDFLTKPIKRDLVFQAIQQWVTHEN